MKNTVEKRIRITKNGKVLRRAMGLGHFRAKKKSKEMNRKSGMRELVTEAKNIQKYASH